jgi:hypothetical protein
MYLSLWIFGLIFTLSDRKIKKLPLWIWIMVGVIPLGLDGGMQYLGSLKMPIFHSFARESTPLLRTITGGVFGLLTGWYIFPSLDVMINNEPFVKRKS